MSLANEHRIHGNLARDVQRGKTRSGVVTAFYVVAVGHQYRDGDTLHTSTDFIPVTTYGKQAESDLKFLAKGKEVLIRGRIRTWYDAGKKKSGFCLEPDLGCVRYIGAPVTRNDDAAPPEELDAWVQEYAAAAHQFDVAPPATRPTRSAANV